MSDMQSVSRHLRYATYLITCGILSFPFGSANGNAPLVDSTLVFGEKDGIVAVEAEHYFKHTAKDVRAFHLTHSLMTPDIKPDGDPPHVAGASGGAYLEILPDTRRTHGDKLIRGTNFSPEPGKMAILHYKVNFSTPGKYYVWVRAHSTGSEDNGLHVGIDGTWPESGRRLQWCEGKKTWRWDSKQRTEKNHCGEPHKIFLQVERAGLHTIHFSMREDGFEFDKWLMTTDRGFPRPKGTGPESNVSEGTLPKPFEFVEAESESIAESDLVSDILEMPASMFAGGKIPGYYLDRDKWLAINPDRHQSATAERTFPYPTGKYDVTLKAVGENDGQSAYELFVDGKTIGTFKNPLSQEMFQEGPPFEKTFRGVTITEGAIIKVGSEIGSKDGKEYSRARWRAVVFSPADQATRVAVKPLIARQPRTVVQQRNDLQTSPTNPVSKTPLKTPRGADGDGAVHLRGEPMQWHKLTVDLMGPYAHEQDNDPNPFIDYSMTVQWTHTDGTTYTIPGYFAADGDAANSSADSGHVWRSHFAPDRSGEWSYKVNFKKGSGIALDATAPSETVSTFSGKSGKVDVQESDKSGRDLRAHGRLQYVGKHYLKFSGTGKYFLKVGADAPETLLAYADFDNTVAGNPKKAPIKKWMPHLHDWNDGDPTWSGGKGKGLIGAINYLSSKGCNAFSFLTYNAGGDGDNVWPFIHRDDKLHYDCSKLDQWGIVFEHGTAKGMYLHFKMQETENDDHVKGKGKGYVPTCLDGGNLGPQRKLYCRELIARFGHNLALNWNLGEENTQSTQQQQAMIDYIAELDAYDHHIVIHTFPNQQDQVYRGLIGDKSKLTGASLQNSSLKTTHEQTVKWVQASDSANKPWVVAFDESGSAKHAQCPDLGYNGFDGHDRNGEMAHTQHEVRKYTLWGTLMAGGAGNEYYFGYQFDENDIVCEDWRSRDQSWDYCRIAIGFFHDHKIPFWEMKNADGLIGNHNHSPTKFCFAKQNDVYLVYLPNGGESEIDLSGASGTYSVRWFNPRTGGELLQGSIQNVNGGGTVTTGNPPTDSKEDWLAVLQAR